ncbi:MAG: LptA/OstA family protein, partial [Acidobacteriota bacterium]
MKRRRLELVVLACGGIFLVYLMVSFHPGKRPATAKARGKVLNAPGIDSAGEATTMLDGFDFTETVGGKPLLRIRADRTVGYGLGAGLAPNLYAGEKVTLTAYPEDGAPVTVHSDRANYDERSRESKLTGNVRWTDTDGSLAETAEARFHPSSRTLEVPGTVHFTRGSMDLTAPSALYDLQERVVRFAGPVQGTGTGAESGGISRLTASAGLFRRDQSVLELESADAESRTGDRFASDHLILKLENPGSRPEWARANGNVRGILSPGGPAAKAAGHAAGAPVERKYTGEQSMLIFDEAGKPKSFTLTGSPALLWEKDRRLTAKQIDIAFAEGRATSARASGGVRIDSADSRGEADQGTLGFGKDGATENAALDGNVHVEAGDRKGQGARAVEVGSGGTWVLTSSPALAAKVESGASRITADRIEIARESGQIRAEGQARAVFAPDTQKKQYTVTFVGDPKRPAYGRGDRITLDDQHHLATLSGSASLWQDTSSLFADDITLSDADKSVTAVQNVRAVMSPPKEKDRDKEKDKEKGSPTSAQDKAASVI